MHKKFTKSIILSSLLMSVLIFANSCKEDEAKPAPVAGFTYEISGTSVTFTNTTTNGSTYAWDFGDGMTSTDESPTHDYGKFGGFVVELTATNESGENSSSAAVQVVPEITIDGDFSDWADIPASSTKGSGNDGAINTIKLVSSLTHIYVYVDGTDALGGFVSMYLNSDADTTTGWAPKNHVFDAMGNKTDTQAGGDFEIDLGGPWSDGSNSAEVWTWLENPGNLEQADWSFEGDEVGGAEKFIAPMKTGNAYEFAIIRASFPGGIEDTMSFLFVDVDITGDDWIETGYLPNDGEGWISHELFK